MNIDKVFVADIYRVEEDFMTKFRNVLRYAESKDENKRFVSYLKTTIVYKSDSNYVDLISKEKYKKECFSTSNGDIYVRSNSLIPVKSYFQVENNRQEVDPNNLVKKLLPVTQKITTDKKQNTVRR